MIFRLPLAPFARIGRCTGRAVTFALVALGLGACTYVSDEPLIGPDTAAFPFAAITIDVTTPQADSLADSWTFVRKGDSYSVFDADQPGPAGYRLFWIAPDHYVVQLPDATHSPNRTGISYTAMKLDLRAKKWGFFDPPVPEGGLPPGLSRCRPDQRSTVCIESLDAFVALARSAMAAGYPEKTADIFWVSEQVGSLNDGLRAFRRGDFAEALTILRPLAAEEIPEAQLALGNTFYSMVPPADDKAVTLFRLAAAAGDAAAQNNLGVMFEKGRGVDQDFEEAAKWYRFAAEQANEQAKKNLNDLWTASPVSWSGGLALPESHRWVQVASRMDLDEAIAIAEEYAAHRSRVVASQNKWFAVVLGPVETTDLNDFRAHHTGPNLPDDTWIARGTNYVATLWAAGADEGTLVKQQTIRALCSYALNNARTGWDNRGRYAEHVAEAEHWRLTLRSCRLSLGLADSIKTVETADERPVIEQLSQADLCTAALKTDRTDWDTRPAFAAHAAEAKRRGLSVDDCRVAIGLPTVPTPTVGATLADADAAFKRREYATALRFYRPLADQGNAEARIALGNMYANGLGVPRDYLESFRWYHLAAEQGHPLAQYRLGFIYETGKGVTKNIAAAVRWYRLAALQGSTYAESRLVRLERLAEEAASAEVDWPDCVKADSEASIRACTRIINAGRETSEGLAVAYYNRGTAQVSKGNYDTAIADYDRAIQLNRDFAEAYFNRGDAHSNKGDSARALIDFRVAVRLTPESDPWHAKALARIAELEMALAEKKAVTPAPAPAPQLPSSPTVFTGDGVVVTVSRRQIKGVEVEWVAVEGGFEPEDERFFKQALLTVVGPEVVVSLKSDGGDLQAGMAIGRTIWSNGYSTVVKSGKCASACALAWLAGRPRFAAPGAEIGFHAPTRVDDPDRKADSAGSALVGGYLTELGFRESAIIFMTEKQPDDMNWLKSDGARSLGIYVEDWDEEWSEMADPR